MKRSLIFLIIFFLSIGTSFALDKVIDVGRTPFAYEKINATTAAAVGLTSTYADVAGAVFITVESNNIRWTIDSTTPTSDTGHLLVSSAYQNIYLYDPASIKAFRMIGITNTAVVHVTYYMRNR